MSINFARAVKNFHNVDLEGVLGIGMGKSGGNWMGRITALR